MYKKNKIKKRFGQTFWKKKIMILIFCHMAQPNRWQMSNVYMVSSVSHSSHHWDTVASGNLPEHWTITHQWSSYQPFYMSSDSNKQCCISQQPALKCFQNYVHKQILLRSSVWRGLGHNARKLINRVCYIKNP